MAGKWRGWVEFVVIEFSSLWARCVEEYKPGASPFKVVGEGMKRILGGCCCSGRSFDHCVSRSWPDTLGWFVEFLFSFKCLLLLSFAHTCFLLSKTVEKCTNILLFFSSFSNYYAGRCHGIGFSFHGIHRPKYWWPLEVLYKENVPQLRNKKERKTE